MRSVRSRWPFVSAGAMLVSFVVSSLASSAALGAQGVNRYGNPPRVTPAPTTAAIDVRDLQIRLYQFADDSMQGRQVGRVGNRKGTDYIAAEVKRLGLVPAGDNGTYFQNLPFHVRKFTDHSRLTVDGNPLQWNADFVAVPGQRAPRFIVDAEVVYGGIQGIASAQISSAAAAGKFVVLLPAPGGARAPQGQAFAMRPGFAPAAVVSPTPRRWPRSISIACHAAACGDQRTHHGSQIAPPRAPRRRSGALRVPVRWIPSHCSSSSSRRCSLRPRFASHGMRPRGSFTARCRRTLTGREGWHGFGVAGFRGVAHRVGAQRHRHHPG